MGYVWAVSPDGNSRIQPVSFSLQVRLTLIAKSSKTTFVWNAHVVFTSARIKFAYRLAHSAKPSTL